jgi:hypothetical protein
MPLVIRHRTIQSLPDIVIGIMVVVAPSENVTVKPQVPKLAELQCYAN